MVRFIKESILPLVEWDCPVCKEVVITRFYIRKLQQVVKCPLCNEGKLIITAKTKEKQRNGSKS